LPYDANGFILIGNPLALAAPSIGHSNAWGWDCKHTSY
jgi:hypothetical protein